MRLRVRAVDELVAEMVEELVVRDCGGGLPVRDRRDRRAAELTWLRAGRHDRPHWVGHRRALVVGEVAPRRVQPGQRVPRVPRPVRGHVRLLRLQPVHVVVPVKHLQVPAHLPQLAPHQEVRVGLLLRLLQNALPRVVLQRVDRLEGGVAQLIKMVQPARQRHPRHHGRHLSGGALRDDAHVAVHVHGRTGVVHGVLHAKTNSLVLQPQIRVQFQVLDLVLGERDVPARHVDLHQGRVVGEAQALSPCRQRAVLEQVGLGALDHDAVVQPHAVREAEPDALGDRLQHVPPFVLGNLHLKQRRGVLDREPGPKSLVEGRELVVAELCCFLGVEHVGDKPPRHGVFGQNLGVEQKHGDGVVELGLAAEALVPVKRDHSLVVRRVPDHALRRVCVFVWQAGDEGHAAD
mmetsp:Transcript_4485/g.10954  ORF Transcript_4485/g.10954 Transcript_4485/m.10954 type:complete len:405 (+) Transcript_4485:646-1860(+)